MHGAFMGSWCWEGVADRLRAAGHDVDAPDLPGSGSDSDRVADAQLESYVGCVGGLLAQGEKAVLVGHSLGGVTVAASASRYPAAVLGQIYVAAFLPRHGQSAAELTRLPEGRGEGLRRRMIVSAGQPPVATMSPSDAVEVLFNTCSAKAATEAAGKLTPHAPWIANAALEEQAAGCGARSYVVCTRDRALPPDFQRHMAREGHCAPVLELPTDHSPFLSSPAELTALLIGLGTSSRSLPTLPR